MQQCDYSMLFNYCGILTGHEKVGMQKQIKQQMKCTGTLKTMTSCYKAECDTDPRIFKRKDCQRIFFFAHAI